MFPTLYTWHTGKQKAGRSEINHCQPGNSFSYYRESDLNAEVILLSPEIIRSTLSGSCAINIQHRNGSLNRTFALPGYSPAQNQEQDEA
jgi:hypothetical protein